MKLAFLDLVVADFKSFRGEHRFNLDAFDAGLHFISGDNRDEPRLGPNGAGKSALLVDALTWCLYGKTPGGLRNPDVRPWQRAKVGDTYVAVTLKLDADTVKVERSTSPQRNSFEIDGKPGDDIAKLIGLNFDLFCNTIVLAQGQPLFFDLPPRDKMQLFVDVLELDRWDQRSLRASTRVTELEREAAQADGELTGISGQLKQTETLLKTAQVQSSEWDARWLKADVESEATLAKLAQDYERIRAKAGAADLASDTAGVKLKERRKEVDEQLAMVRDVQIMRTETQAEMRQVANQIAAVKADLKVFGDAVDCPICGEPIRKGSQIDKHLRELKAKLADLAKAAGKLAATDDHNNRALLDEERRLLEGRKEIAGLEKQAFAAEADVRLYAPRLAAVQAEITAMERDRLRLKQEVNPHQEQIGKLKRDQRKLGERRDKLSEEIEVLTRAVERNKFWVKGFKDIRLMVIEDVLQELELTSNAMLAEVGLVDWQVRYDIEKETKAGTVQRGLNVSIISPQSRNPVRWESWSGGEGQRLRLVGALALSDVLLAGAGIDPDAEILDEPTRHLSLEGVRDLCDYLAERAEQLGRRTWLIDHMAVESSQFASVVTIVKDGGGSKIVGNNGNFDRRLAGK